MNPTYSNSVDFFFFCFFFTSNTAIHMSFTVLCFKAAWQQMILHYLGSTFFKTVLLDSQRQHVLTVNDLPSVQHLHKFHVTHIMS